MRFVSSTLVIALMASGIAVASPPANAMLVMAVAAEKGTPPGLAKKGGVPPGLAKQFGAAVPAKAYIAIDPRYDDRAWFLIDGSWVLRRDFDSAVRVEVRSLKTLPPVPEPPVPLPAMDIAFRVVLLH